MAATEMLLRTARDSHTVAFRVVMAVCFADQYDESGGLRKEPKMARPSTGTNLSLAQLQQIMETRRSEINRLRKQRAEWQKKVDQIDRQIERIGGDGNGRRGGGTRARNENSLNDTIDQVLRGSNKPMSVGDILEAVRAAGYRSSSANFRGIVNQALIKDKRFVAAARGMYQVKK